ncbi:trypsin [Culex quinquefasciatus]|uniref:Trypsin n=1 Tax=Culex quinquefasciatus TaxID=7176 RepID=B0X373_CULQU|nr:trypsin [Culex quinquefasciatus]|eukprot:XP_001864095.1 trypsin [Culex quinquefasciatus]
MLECPEGDRSASARCTSTGQARVVCCPITAQALCIQVPIHRISRAGPHVVGNTENANVGDFPFMGLLKYKDRTKRCGKKPKKFELRVSVDGTGKNTLKKDWPKRFKLGIEAA